jgi:hypothetical protein
MGHTSEVGELALRSGGNSPDLEGSVAPADPAAMHLWLPMPTPRAAEIVRRAAARETLLARRDALLAEQAVLGLCLGALPRNRSRAGAAGRRAAAGGPAWGVAGRARHRPSRVTVRRCAPAGRRRGRARRQAAPIRRGTAAAGSAWRLPRPPIVRARPGRVAGVPGQGPRRRNPGQLNRRSRNFLRRV